MKQDLMSNARIGRRKALKSLGYLRRLRLVRRLVPAPASRRLPRVHYAITHAVVESRIFALGA